MREQAPWEQTAHRRPSVSADVSHCIEVLVPNSPHTRLVCPGDPVRVHGKNGLWRYIASTGTLVELVGAYATNGDPKRTQEVARFFELALLRFDRKAKREQVMQNPEIKTWRRR